MLNPSSTLQRERKRSSAERAPANESALFQQRQRSVEAIRERSGALEQAAAVLQRGIAGSQQKVVLSNDAAFRAVRGSFQALLAELLPSVRVGLCV